MNRQVLSSLFLGVCVFTLGSTCARADRISNFNSGSQGWQVVSFTNLTTDNFSVFSTTAPTFNAAGGNPGGFISTADPNDGDLTFSAPGKFLGNQTGATGLSYNLIYPTGAVDYQPTDVILMGNGETLLFKANPNIVPGPDWLSVSLSFSPSTEWHVGTSGGALATAADFDNVLGNLTGLFIRGEYSIGLVENPGLDNVRLAGVSNTPEPGTLTMLALLGVSVVVFRRVARNRQPAA